MKAMFRPTLIFLLLCFMFIHARPQFMGGRAELSYQYAENVYYNYMYPKNYMGINLRQDFKIATLPFSINIMISNLNELNRSFYPNYINISYDEKLFRKELLQKLNSAEELKYLTEMNKQNQKQLLNVQVGQIDSVLKEVESVNYEEMSIIYKNKLAKSEIQDSIDYYTNMLLWFEEQKNTIEYLKYMKKNREENAGAIEINDSLIKTLKELKENIH